MERKKNILFAILSIIFEVALLFFTIFIWVRYFIFSLSNALLISAIATLVIYSFFRLIFSRREKKKRTTKEEEEKIEKIALSFLFSDDKENIAFFEKVLKEKGKTKTTSRFILLEKDEKRILFIPFFTFNKFTSDNLIFCFNLSKKENPDKLIILTNEKENEAESLSKKLSSKIVILEKDEIYFELLKPLELYPAEKEKIDIKKKNAHAIFSACFSRRKTKSYLFCSLFLMLSSFFVRRNIYYVVFSSILLLLSLFSFLSPFWKKEKKESVFD